MFIVVHGSTSMYTNVHSGPSMESLKVTAGKTPCEVATIGTTHAFPLPAACIEGSIWGQWLTRINVERRGVRPGDCFVRRRRGPPVGRER